MSRGRARARGEERYSGARVEGIGVRTQQEDARVVACSDGVSPIGRRQGEGRDEGERMEVVVDEAGLCFEEGDSRDDELRTVRDVGRAARAVQEDQQQRQQQPQAQGQNTGLTPPGVRPAGGGAQVWH